MSYIIQVLKVKLMFTCLWQSSKSILHFKGSFHRVRCMAKFQSIANLLLTSLKPNHSSECKYRCIARILKSILLFISPQDMNYKKQWCDVGYLWYQHISASHFTGNTTAMTKVEYVISRTFGLSRKGTNRCDKDNEFSNMTIL